MASALLGLIHNLSEEIQKFEYKFGHNDKKCETSSTKYKNYDCFLEYTNFKDKFIEYKNCFCCSKSYQNKNNNFLMHTYFLTLITMILYYYCQKVFILTNI